MGLAKASPRCFMKSSAAFLFLPDFLAPADGSRGSAGISLPAFLSPPAAIAAAASTPVAAPAALSARAPKSSPAFFFFLPAFSAS
jgi:hypothetical protein